MEMIPLIFLLLAKFTLPFLIFLYPFQASWANFILDTIDGDLLMHFGLAFGTYQTVDKITDYVTYIVMLLVGRKWKLRKLIIVLFVLRTIGQGLFFTTNNEVVFFFFPNFLEPLFMAYAFLLFRYKNQAYEKYKRYRFLIWGIIIPYKMANEWVTHIGNIELSEIFFGINN